LKVIHCFLNGPYLGGAERSFILQAADVRDRYGYDVRFFVPFLERPAEDKTLMSFLETNGFRAMKIHHFRYNSSLFSLSRSEVFLFFLKLPLALFGFFKTASAIHKIEAQESDTWWVGGNKVGFILYFLALTTSFKGRFLWHFRDYPFAGGFYGHAWKILKVFKGLDLSLVGNSYDVKGSLERLINSKKVEKYCLYNPVGNLNFSMRPTDNGFSIGTASMFAPWKGLHSLILFAGLFEQELKELGIREFVIYGDEIYKTNGAHIGYRKSLERLQRVFLNNSTFIRFAGLQKPEVIFEELDVFIHSSLKPEPFGRVLIESYNSGTVLISSGLGGAGELVDDGQSGHIFIPHDYVGLLEKVALAVGKNRDYYREQGKLKALEVQDKYDLQLENLFG